MRKEFDRATEKETAVWTQLGVLREASFMIPPSGSLHAAIACHLHCPSFSVADPYKRLTADESNVSIKQVLDTGLTPDRCLIYDHLPRREVLNGLRFYPHEILQIQEAFTDSLRQKVLAIVDICWGSWGSYVRERMIQTCHLTPLEVQGCENLARMGQGHTVILAEHLAAASFCRLPAASTEHGV